MLALRPCRASFPMQGISTLAARDNAATFLASKSILTLLPNTRGDSVGEERRLRNDIDSGTWLMNSIAFSRIAVLASSGCQRG